MLFRILAGMLTLMISGTAFAELRVAATTGNMGMLARTVGGEFTEVTVMAPPDRDPHYLEARPSMMAALRSADIVVAVGSDLEVGWLPAAIQGANNPRVQTGQPGYFEAAASVDLLGQGAPADRAAGDVHPAGNPHVYFDPVRMGEIARALAERFARLDGDNAGHYRQNAQGFAEAVTQRMPGWRERLAEPQGLLQFHKDANYLAERFDVPVLGFMEPLPGIPPTARHLRSLVDDLAGEQGVIVYLVYHPADAAEFMAGELGWPEHRMRSNVGVDATSDDYFALIDEWVSVLE